MLNKSKALATIILLSTSFFAQAETHQQLLRCSNTQFENGAYGQYYGMTYHGTDLVCASDALTKGEIYIEKHLAFPSFNHLIRIELEGAGPDPFILYEVYWVPMGSNPIDLADISGDGTRIKIGNVITDCNHNTNSYIQDLSSPSDLSTPPIDVWSRIGDRQFSGHFLLYSRGTQGETSDGSCDPSKLTKSSFSPVLWGGATDMFDGVQFISGHRLPFSRSFILSPEIPTMELNEPIIQE